MGGGGVSGTPLPAAIFIAMLWLTGCAQVGNFTAADAQAAAAINPANAACYAGFQALGEAQGMATDQPGILTLIATKQQLQAVLQNPACSTIELAVLAELLKLGVPGAALVLP